MTDNRTNEPTPERWRKKPVEIEARRFSGAMELIDAEGLALWCGGTFKHDTGVGQEYKTYYWSIEIPTIEGTMRATPGDYIIRGVQGEFYPCRGDIFEQTYERAALTAAGVAPQEPGGDDRAMQIASEIARMHTFTTVDALSIANAALALAAQPLLDPDKVAEVIRNELRKGEYATTPDELPYAATSRWIARALCEAAKRGELS